MKKKEQIQKKVSIIMPTYNRGYIIKKAIHSVMRQTYPDWELIIVDDGSKDDTLDKVASFQDKRIVCFHYNENLGSNHARNVGIAMSKGKYIAFLDSDNQWDMSYLEKQIACLENPKNIQDIVFAKTEIVHTDFSVVFPKESGEKLKSSFGMIKSAMFGSIFDTNVVCMKKKYGRKRADFVNH